MGEERSSGALETAILLTSVYSDLFDYPLSEDELYGYLTIPCPDRRQFDRALAVLEQHPDRERRLVRRDGYLCRAGREGLADVRRQRYEIASGRWPAARRFGRWLARVPFVRMVAVCGSLAVENSSREGDVDLFLVTVPGRLWLVHTAAMILKRCARPFLGVELCPNYFLTTDTLEVAVRDLYTAREIVQAVPLWGDGVYHAFLDANRWIEDFFPQARLEDRRRFLETPPRRRLAGLGEALLGGKIGHLLDRFAHGCLLRYYGWRLRHHGWTRRDIEGAYSPDRQVVVTGGFSGAVAERFFEAAAGLADRQELERWFYGAAPPADREPSADPLYSGILRQRYGTQG